MSTGVALQQKAGGSLPPQTVTASKPVTSPEQQAFLNVATAAAQPNNKPALATAEQTYVQVASKTQPPPSPAKPSQPTSYSSTPKPSTPQPTPEPPPPKSSSIKTTSITNTVVSDVEKVGSDIKNFIGQVGQAGGGGALISPSGKGTTFVSQTPKAVITRYNSPAMQKTVLPTVEAVGITGGAILFPEIVIPSIVIGEGANIGISSVVSGKLVLPKTPQQVLTTATESTVFGLTGAGVLGVIGETGATGAVIAGHATAQDLLESTISQSQAVAVRIGIFTGLGAGGGAILSKGNPQVILESAAFGAAMGAGSEAFGYVSAKTGFGQSVNDALSNISEKTFGVKATEIVGAKEYYQQETEVDSGKATITINRITEPTTQEVTLKGNDIEYYRVNNLNSLRNPTVDLAGVATVKIISPDAYGDLEEITRYNQPIESSRTAEPLRSALQGKELTLAKVDVGNLKDMVATPSDYSAVEKVMVQSGKGGVGEDSSVLKAENPVTILQKIVVTNEEAIVPKTLFSSRDYTTIQIRGIPDESMVGGIAKSLPDDIAQDIYGKLGGGTKPLVDYGTQTRDLSGPEKPLGGSIGSTKTETSTDLNIDQTKNVSPSNPSTSTPTLEKLETPQQTEITLPRPIVDVAAPKNIELSFNAITGSFLSANPFTTPRTKPYYYQQNKTQPMEDEDLQSIIYPAKSPLTTPNIISTLLSTQQTSQPQTQIQSQSTPNIISTLLSTQQTSQPQTQIQSQFSIPTLLNIPVITPAIVPIVIQKTQPITTPATTPKTTTDTTQTTTETTPTTTTTFPTYPTPQELYFPQIPNGLQFGLGGYSPTQQRRRGLLTQRNIFPILTAKQFINLNLFGTTKTKTTSQPKTNRGMIVIQTPIHKNQKRLPHRKKRFGDLY